MNSKLAAKFVQTGILVIGWLIFLGLGVVISGRNIVGRALLVAWNPISAYIVFTGSRSVDRGGDPVPVAMSFFCLILLWTAGVYLALM